MRKKVMALLKSMGLQGKKKLTTAEFKKADATFKEKHGITLADALDQIAEEEKLAKSAEKTMKRLDTILSQADDDVEERPNDDEHDDDYQASATEDEEAEEDINEEGETITDEIEDEDEADTIDEQPQLKKAKKVIAQNKKLKKQVKNLSAEQDPANPKKVKMDAIAHLARVLGHSSHTKTHLFGIEHDLYALGAGNWWNGLTATRTANPRNYSSDQTADFKAAFKKLSEGVQNRYLDLKEGNQLGTLNFSKLAVGEAQIDYSPMSDMLGEYYRIRRTDLIIAYIRALTTVKSVFPQISGVQDEMAMTNSFVGDFSQSYQPGRVFKGNIAITPEKAKVRDVMFKHLFSNLKDLEREYIGYLNREGSDPMKWTFLEYIFISIYIKLNNEFNQRAIMGYRIEPVTNQIAHHLNASDGVLTTIERYINELKLLPYDAKGPYTQNTIVDYVEAFMEHANSILPSLEGLKLYINEKHVPWYKKNFREKYGEYQDFNQTKLVAQDYSDDLFIPVPNMPYECYSMWLTMPGNIELYTLDDSEMLNIYFERELESLIAASWWKEGSGAYMTGFPYKTLVELQASKGSNAFILPNDPSTILAAGATTANADVNFMFKTSDNAAATKLTDISNARAGYVYRIVCGGKANATTIKKAAVFSEITADWVPTDIGDYLYVTQQLQLDPTTNKLVPTGKWLEVARKITA